MQPVLRFANCKTPECKSSGVLFYLQNAVFRRENHASKGASEHIAACITKPRGYRNETSSCQPNLWRVWMYVGDKEKRM
jgi:hypothetical protein